MTNFNELFAKIKSGTSSSSTGMSLLNPDLPLRVYYGLSSRGFYRLAFMASSPAPEMPSTAAIKVVSIQESANVFWTCFDLCEASAAIVFFTFCSDMVDVVSNSVDKTQDEILLMLKNRYMAWKEMFRQNRQKLSEEQLIGLFGELYFLKNFLFKHFPASVVVQGWSGVDRTNKDFSIEDKWYEVKTISVNMNNVKINSLAQLTSDKPGVLSIIRYEKMSESYEDAECTVYKLFKSILTQITDEEVRTNFIMKLVTFGFDILGEERGPRLKVCDMCFYRVVDGFPRIQEADIKFEEIDKVSYTLIVKTLEKFKFNGEL